MKRKNKILIVFALMFTMLTSLFINVNAETKDNVNELKIHYIDVGQGDSILVQVNNKNLLIDAGTNESEKKLIEYLDKQNIKKLDYVVATHPHEDHIGGMAAVIKKYPIGEVYAPKKSSTTKTYENMLNEIKAKNLKISEAKAGVKLDLDKNVNCEMLAPNSNDYEDTNNYSAVIKITYGDNSFLFTGDAEAISEMEMVKKDINLKADVLKVGHHGSNSSTCSNFLDKVNPKYAVISVGKGNDYGHPNKAVMDKLKAKNITVYRTDECGSIVTISNGKEIKFDSKPSTYNYADNNKTINTSKTVYWTPSGKSYHYDKDCSALSRSKTIIEGKLSECPKGDPCDRCAK